MWIVKLGGSLATAETLPVWLDALSSHGGGQAVVVPGGGPFAELVLRSQEYWCFDDSSAHFMALLGMAQYGLMLAGVQPDLVPVELEADLHEVLKCGGVPIWLPTLMVNDDPEVEHSWDVTSDSLAAWLAARVHADHLLLVKSVPLADGPVDVGGLVRQGIVDAAFAAYAAKGEFSICVLSKDQCELMPHVLNGDPEVMDKVCVPRGVERASRLPRA